LATVKRKSAICSHGWRILQMLRLPSMSTEKSKSLAGILVLNFKNCYSSSIEFYESHSTKLLTNGFFFVDSWNRMFFLCSSHFYSWRGRRNKGKSQSLRPVLNLNAAVVIHILSKHLLPSYDVFTVRKRHTSLQQLLTER
jgi:hypothetical protein